MDCTIAIDASFNSLRIADSLNPWAGLSPFRSDERYRNDRTENFKRRCLAERVASAASSVSSIRNARTRGFQEPQMTLFARRSSWRRRFTSFAPERSFCPRIFVRGFMKNSVPNQKKKGRLEAALEIRPRGFEPLTFGSGDQRSIRTELRARGLNCSS